MLAMVESSACMPEAQLRITVHPGTLCPQPKRSAATRPMFTSSTEGAAQPRITSSRSAGAKGWRTSSSLPAAVARSLAENGPGRLRDFRNGVRAPSMMKMSLATASRRGALRLRRPARFGQSEILREIVHADHLVAQLRRALEQRLLLASDHVRRERSLRELLGRFAVYRPGFLRCADLGLDRLGLDRRLEGGLETSERFALRLRQVHAGAEPVARGRRRDEQTRDFVPERVARRREVPAKRKNHEAQERAHGSHRIVRE